MLLRVSIPLGSVWVFQVDPPFAEAKTTPDPDERWPTAQQSAVTHEMLLRKAPLLGRASIVPVLPLLVVDNARPSPDGLVPIVVRSEMPGQATPARDETPVGRRSCCQVLPPL